MSNKKNDTEMNGVKPVNVNIKEVNDPSVKVSSNTVGMQIIPMIRGILMMLTGLAKQYREKQQDQK